MLKMGFIAEELKAGNPNKVSNDLGDMRKKQFDIVMPGKEDVEKWFG